MANVFHPTSNTWVIDTPSANVIDARRLRIHTIKWRGGTTPDHEAIVTDAAGGHVWGDIAAGANYVSASYEEGKTRWISGLKVPTLGSGVLEIVLA
jgi:hypothetical protein